MTVQAIIADRAFTPYEEIAEPVILIEDGKIAAIGPRDRVALPAGAVRREARGLTAVPGFLDMHIHGAGGHDVMEASAEALATIAGTVARMGTTSFVATTVTASEESTCRAVAACAGWMRSHSGTPSQALEQNAPQAEILGIHLEGPFISPARRGVHPPKWIAAPSIPLFDRLLTAGAVDAAGDAGSAVRILTLAPELPGAIDLIDFACKGAGRGKGIIVSLGHTDADYAQTMHAIEHGASHAAHVFNAMRPFEHRETGVIGAVLTAPSVTAELIADGIHVDAAAMRILLAAKGPRGIVLVSDGIAATGMPDGTYRLGNFDVSVKGGVPRNAEGKLAGSTLTLDRALRTMLALGVPVSDALAMLTANPARELGIERRKGHLAVGGHADLVFLDKDYRVAGVMTRGAGGPEARG